MRSGLVAPALAVALSALGAGMLGSQYADHRADAASRVWAQRLAKDNARQQRVRAASGQYLVEDRATAPPLPFLRALWTTAPTSRALDPASDADKAIADAAVAALHGRAALWATPRGYRAAAPTADGRAAVVEIDRYPSAGMPWWALTGAAALGWLLWLGVLRLWPERRWTASLGAALAAAPLAVVTLWALARVDVGLKGLGPPEDGVVDGSLIFAALLLPLVVVGVAGAWTRSRRSPHRTAYGYVVPAMLGMLLLILVPFVLGVGLAFTRHHQGSFTWVGLANFIDILTVGDVPITAPLSFYFTLVVTLLWTALNVFLHVSIGLGLALLLRDPDLRLKGLYRVLLIVPWAVPNYITALIWKGMFNKQYGLINEVLGLVGLEPVGWFSSFWTAFMANVTTNTWLGFPFMMVVALGALQSIPRDLYEAARVDGAGRWQQFRAITLPLLKPALFPAIILGSIWTFNMFNIIYLVSGGAPEGGTDILITEAYRWAFEQDRHGYAAAYSVLIFLILLMYSLLTQRAAKAAEETYE